MMKRRWFALALMGLLLSGCMGAGVPGKVDTFLQQPTVQVPPPPAPSSPGSLFNDSGSLYADLKAHRVGDIVTVTISEQASASKQATTTTGRKSTASAGLQKLFGLDRTIGNISHAIDPSSLVDTSYQTDFKGSGSTSRNEDLVATLTTRVVAVLPNGNLRIAGSKSVRVNNEDQLIGLTGEIRPEDISSNNSVDSKYILDARISYTGKGVISDNQGQGWLVRVLDNIWPF